MIFLRYFKVVGTIFGADLFCTHRSEDESNEKTALVSVTIDKNKYLKNNLRIA